eukprot:TRINITY_DN6240_c0_g1_i3.p1 TRINITY_DN6240_c0_g1~~TRINITY_DN6240_c0_g1_i3.p1  ORF type:complete len:495 (-),score=48.67 TRINITY_DN6240_c0_g1_i3:254-1738(-)
MPRICPRGSNFTSLLTWKTLLHSAGEVVYLGADSKIKKPVIFWSRKLTECLEELLCDPDIYADVSFEPTLEHNDDGDRVFGSFNTGIWFQNFYTTVRSISPALKALHFTLYSDEALVYTVPWGRRKVKLHPIFVSLAGNLREMRRADKGAVLAGYLPVLQKEDFFLPQDKFTLLKLHLHHACLHQLLQPVRDCYKRRGVQLKVSDGSQERFMLGLCAVLADKPEHQLHWAARLVNSYQPRFVSAAYICGTCAVTADAVTNFDALHNLEGHKKIHHLLAVLERASGVATNHIQMHATAKLAFQELTKLGFHPVLNGFRDLPFFDMAFGFLPCSLHDMFLGLVKKSVEWSTEIFKEAGGGALGILSKHMRATAEHLFNMGQVASIDALESLTVSDAASAKEVLFALPYALDGLATDISVSNPKLASQVVSIRDYFKGLSTVAHYLAVEKMGLRDLVRLELAYRRCANVLASRCILVLELQCCFFVYEAEVVLIPRD